MSKSVTIEVPILARVEGEGALELIIRDQKIETLKLKIYEPPRFFEKFLEGRSYNDVLDIVARICGICPVAYQMTAAHAIEQCFGVHPGPWVRLMRRLFYCGEWIESHTMHIHFLALPDFLGFSSAPEMAKQYPDVIHRGLRLHTFGNELIKCLGARAVHPVGACVGGFFKAPSKALTSSLLEKANACINDCEALISWLATLQLPDHSHDFTCVSLHHADEYPFNEGEIISSNGLKISPSQFDQHFKEYQVPYSNALHCTLENKTYLVGPLARVNNCYQQLEPPIHGLLNKVGFQFPSNNMSHSIMARAIEIYHCVLEAIRILEQYDYPESSRATVKPQAGFGVGCTEAPRGLLWHRYEIDDEGKIKSSRIVPPTSQNQARIEEDLRVSLHQFGLDKDQEVLRTFSEMVIRNYDPCISCSTHFLDLRVYNSE